MAIDVLNGKTRWLLLIFGGVLALLGSILSVGGVRLLTMGGSWYYL